MVVAAAGLYESWRGFGGRVRGLIVCGVFHLLAGLFLAWMLEGATAGSPLLGYAPGPMGHVFLIRNLAFAGAAACLVAGAVVAQRGRYVVLADMHARMTAARSGAAKVATPAQAELDALVKHTCACETSTCLVKVGMTHRLLVLQLASATGAQRKVMAPSLRAIRECVEKVRPPAPKPAASTRVAQGSGGTGRPTRIRALIDRILDGFARGDRAAIRGLVWTDAEIAKACGGDARRLLRDDLARDPAALVSLGDSQKRPTEPMAIASLVKRRVQAAESCYALEWSPERGTADLDARLRPTEECAMKEIHEVGFGRGRLAGEGGEPQHRARVDMILEINGELGLSSLPLCVTRGATLEMKSGMGERAGPAMDKARESVRKALEKMNER